MSMAMISVSSGRIVTGEPQLAPQTNGVFVKFQYPRVGSLRVNLEACFRVADGVLDFSILGSDRYG